MEEYFKILSATDDLIDLLPGTYPKEKMKQCVNALRALTPSHISLGFVKDMHQTTEEAVRREMGDVVN